MKRLIGWMAVLSFLIFTVMATAADETMQDEKLRLEAAEIKLNNLEWKIKLNPMGETKSSAYEDTLSFINSQVFSERLVSEGFSTSSYTVSLKGDDVVVWETMQTSESAGLAFWHGELEDDVMRGVLSKHLDEKTRKDFSFYSIEKRELAPQPPKVEEIKKEAVPEPAKAEEDKEEVAPKKVEEEIEEKPAPEGKNRRQ